MTLWLLNPPYFLHSQKVWIQRKTDYELTFCNNHHEKLIQKITSSQLPEDIYKILEEGVKKIV